MTAKRSEYVALDTAVQSHINHPAGAEEPENIRISPTIDVTGDVPVSTLSHCPVTRL